MTNMIESDKLPCHSFCYIVNFLMMMDIWRVRDANTEHGRLY
jgi:hypothetical protein